MSLPNPGMSFTPFDPLPASDMNDIVENIEALAAGTGLNDGSIVNAKIAANNLYASKLYNPYKFLLYRNAARSSGASTFIAVQHDTKIFDTGSNVDIVTNKGRFTAPVAGFYHFDGCISVNAGTGDSLACLYKNGARHVDGNRFSTGGPINQYVLSVTLQLAANDTIELQLFTATSQSLVVGIGTSMSNFFGGHLVSST